MALKKVRILVDCHYGRCNDVASLTPAEIKEAKQASLVDDHPDAVKYAEGLTSDAPEPTLNPDNLPPAASEPPEPEPAAPDAAQPALDLGAPDALGSPETADTTEDHGRKAGRKS